MKYDVMGFVAVYNEADILPWALKKMKEQGVQPYVIDNWSTDGSREIAIRGAGMGCYERFPIRGASLTYDWGAILTRVEGLCLRFKNEFQWFMLWDADEFRYAPSSFQGLTVAEVLKEIRNCGRVDFKIENYVPIKGQPWDGKTDPEEHFRYRQRQYSWAHLPHIRAWRGLCHNLAASGGHAPDNGEAIFPVKFVTKHYPIRSQTHGERKVFQDRQPRWNPEERAKGMHVQYDHVTSLGHVFEWDQDDPALEAVPIRPLPCEPPPYGPASCRCGPSGRRDRISLREDTAVKGP